MRGVTVSQKVFGKGFATLLRILVIGFVAQVSASQYVTEVEQRIQPAGSVCVEGEECEGVAVAAAGGSSGAPRSGDEVFQASCFACHGTGLPSAPQLKDAAAWAPRIAKGVDVLIANAINGFQAMPAKGGCASCSDEEVEAAVKHILDNSQ